MNMFCTQEEWKQPSGAFGDFAPTAETNCCMWSCEITAAVLHIFFPSQARHSTYTILWKWLPSHHGDGQSATREEREERESCHWLRKLRERMEEPTADKMAMLRRTKVDSAKGHRALSLLLRHVVLCFQTGADTVHPLCALANKPRFVCTEELQPGATEWGCSGCSQSQEQNRRR